VSAERSWLAAAVSSHASRYFLALLLCSLTCGLGCGVGGEADAGDAEAAPPPTGSTSGPLSEADLIGQLSAIGYLAGTEQASNFQGATQHDPQRVAPGLSSITSGHGPVALLMDMDGEILHEWRAEFVQVFPDHPRFERAKEHRRNFWRDALLFPNGDILVIWELFGLFKLDRGSRVLWAVPEPAHSGSRTPSVDRRRPRRAAPMFAKAQSGVLDCDRREAVLLQPAEPGAARNEREHEPSAAPVLPERRRAVGFARKAGLNGTAHQPDQWPRKTLDFPSPAEVLNESVALAG
jgi:hypothetical protein